MLIGVIVQTMFDILMLGKRVERFFPSSLCAGDNANSSVADEESVSAEESSILGSQEADLVVLEMREKLSQLSQDMSEADSPRSETDFSDIGTKFFLRHQLEPFG